MIEKYARESSNLQSPFLDEFVLGQHFRNYSIKFYQKLVPKEQGGVFPKKSPKSTEAEMLKAQLLISRIQMKRVKTMLMMGQQQVQSLSQTPVEKERVSSVIRKSSTKKSFLSFF